MELLSQMWSLLGLVTVLQNLLPSQLLGLLHSFWQSLQDALTPFSYLDVPEFLGSSAVEPNELYRDVNLYLHRRLHSPTSSSLLLPRLTLSRPRAGHLALSLSPGHGIEDAHAGHRVVWSHHADALHDSLEERRSFTLRLPKRHAAAILRPYLAAVSAAAELQSRSSRERRLHTNSRTAAWASVPFRHPATFATLALDPGLKARVVADLDSFAGGREFYHRTGRAWKRGYLLHGPPGSGKSSLVAAIANHLGYDVYDLELTKVADNSDLRALLVQTTNRSIIVIEDIDCSLDLTGRRTTAKKIKTPELQGDGPSGRVTLSGLLNFTDGLWSCCGEERVVVFTTNHKASIDAALLRPGRMDMDLHLGPCGVPALREMVTRYLNPDAASHEAMEVAERCVGAGAEITPAEVGELLLRNWGDVHAAMKDIIDELHRRLEGGKGNADSSEAWEEDDSPARNWSPEKKEKNGWEGKVRILRRLRSFTKSDSGRRGV